MGAFRILSLDGGGAWALLQVMALIDLYSNGGDGSDVTGHDILKKFDLVAANSGGTLTLGGLIMDWPLDKLLQLFLDDGMRSKIFVPASFAQTPLSHITQPIAGLGPKYSTAGKFAGLRNILGADGDALVTSIPSRVGPGYAGRKPHVVFCGFNYDTNRETFFRSDSQSLAASRGAPLPVTIAEAINASANPPVNYFDAPAQLPDNTRFWDGAIGGYNNPVLAAVIETLANAARYGTQRASIRALSIGTGNVALPLGVPGDDPDLVSHRQKSDLFPDIAKMATAILDDPPDAASFHAHVMLDGALPAADDELPVSSPVVRLNPLIQPERGTNGWRFPSGLDRKAFVTMRNMPMDATSAEQIGAIRQFGVLWLTGNVRNQPIRANSATLDPEIGEGRYQFAKAAAKQWFS